jgi:DNA-binding SARP family transcriptional activator/WD40 repeat protein
VRYRVLGPLDVVADDGELQFVGGPKQRVVLAVLIAAAGRAVSVDRLLQAMYGEDASPNNRATMHTYVSNLRRTLGDVVVRQGDGYVLRSTGSTTDAVEFEDAYRAATALVAPDEVAGGLRDALVMWRGHPYADVEGHGFLDGEITRLNEVRLTALEARIDADMRAGRHREVVAELDALTVEHPFRENLRAMHMLALYRSGRQSEALRAYGHTRTALVEGLGIDPSPELQEMERRILVQDRTLMATVGPTVQRRAVLVADVDGPWPDPAARDTALARRDSELAAAAGRCGGVTLTPRGMAGYAVFVEPIHAVRAAQAVVNDRTRIAIDYGDLELGEDEPVGPPLVRAARLVAVANPGQALCSLAGHQALTLTGVSGWAAASLGRFDIVGLDGEVDIYQLVGGGFGSDFPPLQLDRLPPLLPRGSERSVPGFELRSLIGVGELGEVHRAYQPSVGREVAVRIFETGMVEHPQFVRRFESASQRITRVEHPTVVPLLDYWREPNRAVMVSRLMTGGHLGERIPDGGFPPADALAIFETVAAGVASAHRHGVVHGRLRPQNILFDDEGNAYVADLGVDEICAGIITFGTTAYDAPERLGGILATPAADVYSLGVLLQQLLSGTPPPLDRPLPTGHDRVAEVIARAIDADPSARPETVDDLVVQLREALAVAVDPTFVAARNPYRGLEAFEQADAVDFFGREHAVAEMVGVLETEHLLVVVGPSGIGKSSVVKAGLVPALRRGAVTGSESWLVTELTPGRAPFDQLTAALERVATVEVPDIIGEIMTGERRLDDIVTPLLPDGSIVLLVVDQFEELFTETLDEQERRAFMDVLADVASRPHSSIRIIATLRADYFDRPLGYAVFGNVLRGRTVALGAMTATELADAVRRPAAAVGVEVDAALVARITGEAERQPGALPLVQHAMAELFERRLSNTITVGDLDESGGLSEALGRRAEAIYGGLNESLRDQARRVFLSLVNVSEHHDNTRRRVRRTELEQQGLRDDELDALLPEFGRHRLLTFDRDPASRTPTVEVAHEALLDHWPRLRAWIDDARDDLLTRRRLAAAAADWLNAGSDPSFLYAGGRLDVAEAWASHSGVSLTDDEHRFLTSGRAEAEHEASARTRRRRAIVGLLGAGLLTTTVLGGFALAQRAAADTQARQARARDLAGQAQLAIAEDPERAVMLALTAMQTTHTPLPEAVSALQAATQADRVVTTVNDVAAQAFDARTDGSIVVVDRPDAPGFTFIDPVTGTVTKTVTTSRPPSWNSLALDPSGRVLGVGYQAPDNPTTQSTNTAPDEPVIEQFEVPGGRSLGTLSGPAGSYESLAYDASARWLAAVRNTGDSSTVMLWDLATHGAPISAGRGVEFRFIPGTDSLVVADLDTPTLTVVHLEPNGGIRTERQIPRPDVQYTAMAVDPAGGLVAVASLQGRRVDILDITTGESRATLNMPSPGQLEFSRDGELLAVAGGDNLIRVYSAPTYTQQLLLAGSPDQPYGLAFSPDSSRLVSAASGQLRSWDLSPKGPAALGNFHATGGFVGSFAVRADQSTALVTVYKDGTGAIERVDQATGSITEVLGDLHQDAPADSLISADMTAATGLDQNFLAHEFNLGTGRSVALGRCEVVLALDRSGATALVDGQGLCAPGPAPPPLPGPPTASRVVDVATGHTILDLGATSLWGGVFGPPREDGRPGIVVVMAGDANDVHVRDLSTGADLGTYAPDNGFLLKAALTADAKQLVLTTTTGDLIVLDLAKLAHAHRPQDAVIWTVKAHNGSVQGLAVSTTGLIATASSAGNARVWSPEGHLLADLPIRPDDVPSVAFASGTNTLYFEDGNQVLRKFSLDPAASIRLARSLVTRPFTSDECTRYFPQQHCPTVHP